MKNNHKNNCPNVLPADIAEERFCIPCECRQQLHTIRYSSPNSALPPMELKELKALLEHLNSILLTFASHDNTENLRGLRFHFKKLRGVLIRVQTECNNYDDSIIGCIKDAGSDYLEIDSVGQHELIPYNKLCSITHQYTKDCDMPHMHEPELLDINPCLRRKLVLNFGEVVSSNPELFQIFFGLPLYLRLLKELNCFIEVKIGDEEDIIKGILVNTDVSRIKVKLICSNTENKEDNIPNTFINAKIMKDEKNPENKENSKIDTNYKEDSKYKNICIDDICFIRLS